MGWVLLGLVIVTFFVALSLINIAPKISLGVSVIVPFLCLYLVGREGITTLFIVFAIMLIVVSNVSLFKWKALNG